MSFDERRFDVIAHLFIDPADQDYIASRWAYRNGLLHAASWGAAQALEKYMKAFLLLNDRSAIDQRHDLDVLFEQVCALDTQAVIPSDIAVPDVKAFGRDDLSKRSMREFVSYLNVFGGAENRYGLRGIKHAWPVQHPLDQLCAALRRGMRGSNFFFGDLLSVSFRPERPDLASYPEWMISLGLRLERVFLRRFRIGDSSESREAFLNLNFAFVGRDGMSEPSGPDKNFDGLVLSMDRLNVHLAESVRRDQSQANLANVRQLRDWVAGNIFLDKATRARLKL